MISTTPKFNFCPDQVKKSKVDMTIRKTTIRACLRQCAEAGLECGDYTPEQLPFNPEYAGDSPIFHDMVSEIEEQLHDYMLELAQDMISAHSK
jgi:hypothetical protein